MINTFRVNKKGVTCLVTSVYGGYEDYPQEIFGYRSVINHDLAKIKDGKLFLGDYEVCGYENEAERFPNLKTVIPTLYTLRTKEGRFLSGLDLVEDGKVWAGYSLDNYFNSIEEAIKAVNDYIKQERPELDERVEKICLEEPMLIDII